MYRHIAFGLVILLVAICVVPFGLANSGGADPGHSGGHVGEGFNCTVCHGFNSGPGGVELLGTPRRYVPGGAYDLTVRVFDAEQAGAGFQISAESATGHQGLFQITDTINTQFSGNGSGAAYVTHTMDGYADSLATWSANGGSYSFHFRWIAPVLDVGPVTFFTAGNAVNNAQAFFGDRFYAAYAIAHYADAPDADGDDDVDLADYAAYQRCFDGGDPATPPSCEFVDVDMRSFLTLLDGPSALLPAGYVLADAVRGGLLYDKWWVVTGAPPPAGNHPLYPEVGQKSGSSTFRCKECHGWDYRGALGAYALGSSHYTGIPGVLGSTLSPQELFDLLQADPVDVPNGHNLGAYGMSDRDLWDVVRMTLEAESTDPYINEGVFQGSVIAGSGLFGTDTGCAACHGDQGRALNFGSVESPEYIGDLARGNPWEFLHKTRFGHPGSPMPASDLLLWDVSEAASVGAYSATLP